MSTTSSDEELSHLETEDVVQSVLPNKSRERYLKAYEDFNKWRAEKGKATFSESGLLVYFRQLSENYKPSSLWSIYSMLKKTLNKKHDVKLEKYTKLTAFLKKQSVGFKSKKANVFSSQDIQTFLKNACDEEFLVTKVVVIMGVCGGCKCHELKSLRQEDITMAGDVIVVRLKNTEQNVDRSFVINDYDYVEIVKKYIQLRPRGCAVKTFFLGFRNGQYVRQPMGKNKLRLAPKQVATFLNLPDADLYNGHSLRRSGGDTGANITTIRKIGRYRPATVTEDDIEECIENKTETNKITDSIEVEWHPESSKLHEATHQEGQQSENLDDHVGFTCHSCHGAIRGFRYSCVECVNYDLCARCEAMREHDQHYMLRVPGPRPEAEFTSVMADIRAALQSRAIPSESVVEIKLELERDDEDIKPIDPLDVLIEYAEPYGSGVGQDEPYEPTRPAEDQPAASTAPRIQQIPALAVPSPSETMVARSEQATMVINPLAMKTVRLKSLTPALSKGKVKMATEKRKSMSKQREEVMVPLPFKMSKQETLHAERGGFGERAGGRGSARKEAELRDFTMQNKRDYEEFDSGVS